MKKKDGVSLRKTNIAKRGGHMPMALAMAFLFIAVFVTLASMLSGISTTYYGFICEKEEHAHTEDCYEMALVCGIGDAPHVHGDDCAIQVERIICGLEEHEPHSHTAACYETIAVRACAADGDDEHEHGPECYVDVEELTCGIEASEGHTHDESCRALVWENVCGFEEGDAHVHTSECWLNILACLIKEHTHTDACLPQKMLEGAASADLEDFLHQMVIKDRHGEVIFDHLASNGGTPVFFEDSYHFELTFKSPATPGGVMTNMDAAGGVLTYALPSGLRITGGGFGGVYFTDIESPVGYYRVTGGRSPAISVQFYDPGAISGTDFEFTLNFTANFEPDFTQGGLAFGSRRATASQMSPAGFAPMSEVDTWDLTNFVTGVIIRDRHGNRVIDGNFLFGETYTFHINFEERLGANGQFEYDDQGFLVYQLPEQLIVLHEINDRDINSSAGYRIGSYSIDTDGRVTVSFGNYRIDGTPTPYGVNFIDYYTNAMIGLVIEAQFRRGTEPGILLFGAGAEFTIISLTNQPAALQIRKDIVQQFHVQDEYLEYELRITATGNRVGNITLRDTLELTAHTSFVIDQDGIFTVNLGEQKDAVQYRVVRHSGVNTIWEYIPITYSGDSWLATFPADLVLDPGDSIEVRYRLNVKPILDALRGASDLDTAFNRGDYSLTLANTATVRGEDINNEYVQRTDYAKAHAIMAKSILSKYGGLQPDGTIRWVVEVGRANSAGIYDIPLGGMVIEDWLGNADDSFLNNNQRIVGDVTVELRRSDNSLIRTDTINDGTPGLPDKWRYNGFSYTVPENIGVYRVRIICFTEHEGGAGFPVGAYNNSVRIGETWTITTVRDGGVVFGHEKTSEFVYDANGHATGIAYTITLDVPEGFSGRVRIEDAMYMAERPDRVWLDSVPANRVFVFQARSTSDMEVVSPEIDIKVEPPVPEAPIPYVQAVVDMDTGVRARGFRVAFGGVSNGSPVWEWPAEYSSEARRVTVSFEISLDAPINGISGETIRDRLNIPGHGWRLVNESFIGQGADLLRTSEFHAIDYLPIQKTSSPTADSSVYDYSVYLNWSEWVATNSRGSRSISHQLFTQAPAIFEDIFDDRLEFVPGSLYVEVYPGHTASFRERFFYAPHEGGLTVGDGYFKLDMSYLRLIPVWNGSVAESVVSDTPIGDLIVARNTRYIVHYQLRLKEGAIQYAHEYEDGKLVAKNTARVYATGPKFSDGVWTSSRTVEFEAPEPLTKEMTEDGNIARAVIEINPLGRRLRPQDIDSDRIIAYDTMSDNLILISGEVTIEYRERLAGGLWGEWVVAEPQPDGLWSVISINPQNHEFHIKDEIPIRITYYAFVDVPIGQQTTIYNKVEVFGFWELIEIRDFVVQQSSMWPGGFRDSLSLHKVDVDDNGIRLEGAVFELYMAWRGDGDPTDQNRPAPDITVNEQGFYHIGRLQEDYGGRYIISNPWLRWGPSDDVVYLIVETKAPEGYVIIDPHTFFVLNVAHRAGWQTTLGADNPVQMAIDDIFVANKAIEAVIIGQKRLEGALPATFSATFGFELTQVNVDGTPYDGPNPVLPGPLYALHASLSVHQGETAYDFEFPPVKRLLDNHTYYFLIEEVDIPLGWRNITTEEQIVKVVVKDGEVTVVYPEGQDSAVFTNALVGARFPDVGGMGRWIFLTTGFTMITLAGAVLLYNGRFRSFTYAGAGRKILTGAGKKKLPE